MSVLFATLSTSAGNLKAFEKALEVTQNNVGNSSTQGYAAQIVDLQSLSFEASSTGATGGVTAQTANSRDRFADDAVRREITSLGTAETLSSSLSGLQAQFDVTSQTGIGSGLNKFYSSFSALSVSPNSGIARDAVISSATALAGIFQQAASTLSASTAEAENQIRAQIDQINELAGKIQTGNLAHASGTGSDPGIEANTQAALDRLAEIANISSSRQADGTTTVLLGGQIPLVQGSTVSRIQFGIEAPLTGTLNPGASRSVQIQDASGLDITSKITGGQLSGLLQVRNKVLPEIRGDSSRSGSLNQLAKTFADRVNSLLVSGNVSTGPPAVPGTPLFTYDGVNSANTAASIAVNTAITASKIATIDPGPPLSSNGIANRIAAGADGILPEDQISGLSFSQFFGQIAATVGLAASNAQDDRQLQSQAVAQGRALQNKLSGVSLDKEAVNLLQYQRAYQAISKLISILDQITQSTLEIIR